MHEPDILLRYKALFYPRTIAVVGASPTGTGPANNFIRHLTEFGFSGQIYPIHHKAAEIEGRRAYASLADTPDPIDYAYIAVGADNVEAALTPGAGRTRFAQVITSGFGESADGSVREARLVDAMRRSQIRMIGPNCLGTHSPAGGLTFVDRALPVCGPVGVLSQSGGLAVDILRRGQGRGLRFSALVSVGNCADVGINELLDYMLADPNTRVIGLYLENAEQGRELFEKLREGGARKPVVLLKGGRTSQGQRVAASHTGALAADYRIWTALARQTGSVLVETLDEFIDVLLAFQCLQLDHEQVLEKVALFGNGGGTSVLATDQFADHGFDLPRFEDDVIAALTAIGLPAGSIITNPIDVPANALRREDGRVAEQILQIVCQRARPQAIVMHVNMTVILGYRGDMLGNLLRIAISVKKQCEGRTHFTLVLRSDGEPDAEEAKRRHRNAAVAERIPVFDELADAARALAAVRAVEQFRWRQFLSL